MLNEKKSPTQQALGVFGGTFDPIHYAHLRLAEEALEALCLEKIRFIPAGMPALKNAPEASPKARSEMVQLAIHNNPRFELDDAEINAEIKSNTPSFTVPTLQRLRGVFGTQKPLVLLVGADAFAQMESWFEWEKLLQLAHIGIAKRPGFSLKKEQLTPKLAALFGEHHTQNAAEISAKAHGKIITFTHYEQDISSTRIRALYKEAKSPRYLLPECVANYLYQHRFYQKEAP